MSNGYTYKTAEGEPETFEQFTLACARAFGAFVHQRDDSHDALPSFREVSTYTVEGLRRAREEKAEWEAKSLDDRRKQYDAELARRVRSYVNMKHENAEKRARYEARLAEIQAWDAPEILQSLKDFMIKQIEESMEWDCREYPESPVQSFADWLDWQDEYVLDSVNRAEKRLAEEVERVREQNEYARALYDSLGVKYGEK